MSCNTLCPCISSVWEQLNFSSCQFGFHVLEYYLAVTVHLNNQFTLTVEKNDVEAYIY
jgi:hypothetical protein